MIPGGLASLDWFFGRMKLAGSAEAMFGGEAAARLSLTPTEYFARNCWVGASFIRPIEVDIRHLVGVDKIMWGADYPHSEGTAPLTREALRASFANVPVDECRAMFAGNAAAVYGFDLTRLAEVADRIGPAVAEVHMPLTEWPAASTCGVFDRDAIIRSW